MRVMDRGGEAGSHCRVRGLEGVEKTWEGSEPRSEVEVMTI